MAHGMGGNLWQGAGLQRDVRACLEGFAHAAGCDEFAGKEFSQMEFSYFLFRFFRYPGYRLFVVVIIA